MIDFFFIILQEPIAVEPWNETVFDASKEGPICIQYNNIARIITGVEDCLRLNIYTHEVKENFMPINLVKFSKIHFSIPS